MRTAASSVGCSGGRLSPHAYRLGFSTFRRALANACDDASDRAYQPCEHTADQLHLGRILQKLHFLVYNGLPRRARQGNSPRHIRLFLEIL